MAKVSFEIRNISDVILPNTRTVFTCDNKSVDLYKCIKSVPFKLEYAKKFENLALQNMKVLWHESSFSKILYSVMFLGSAKYIKAKMKCTGTFDFWQVTFYLGVIRTGNYYNLFTINNSYLYLKSFTQATALMYWAQDYDAYSEKVCRNLWILYVHVISFSILSPI